MSDSSSFKNPAEKNFTNIPEGSEIKLDALFGEEFIDIPAFQTLLQYWKLKKGDRDFPSRKDINPIDIKSILPNIFMLDLTVKDNELTDIYVALMGTEVADLYGEITGKSSDSLQDLDVAKRTDYMSREVLKLREPIANQVNVLTADRPHISVSSIYCPLSTNGKDIDKIIGQVILL